MVKSIVVGACLVLCACVADTSDYSSESNSSNLVTCNKINGEYPCCDDNTDACSNTYSTDIIGTYLGYEAHSNGACTGGGSGTYQCVHYAKDGLWHNKLKFDISDWSERWYRASNGLNVARATIANGRNLFVFDNGSTEPPRETDLLIYENVNCDDDPEDNYDCPGHVSVVSNVVIDSGVVTQLGLIEENLIASGRNQELCDQNLEDSVMRTVTVSFRDDGYFVDFGVSSLQVIGWIRHPLAGIYGDTGWHEDEISQAFRSAYNRWDKDFVGWARDNGGTPFVHTRNGHILQDFVTPGGIGRALVYNPDPNLRKALLVRDGFYNLYLGAESTTGLPLDEEHLDECLSVQNFENGRMCWNGISAIWLRSGSTPPPRVEPELVIQNQNQNQDNQAECYDNDWMPCYTGLISTQNVGVCSGGHALCINEHWQWDVCNDEITPSAENCADGLDNDCDALTDCNDSNCSGLGGCSSELGGGDLESAGGEEEDQINCDADRDGYTDDSCNGNDCDDVDSSIHPGASEALWFDWIDSDCDGRDVPDSDGDGYASIEDCDDNNSLRHPRVPEVCNGIDEDCDGVIDEGVKNACGFCGLLPNEICGDDADNDCDGATDCSDAECSASDFCQVAEEPEIGDSDGDGDPDGEDCAPGDSTSYHGAIEVCDYEDDDCDGAIDEGVRNACHLCGALPLEECNDNMDNDCDGEADEGCPIHETDSPDADGDGYSPPEDCEDLDSWRYPGAREYCNCVDDDCDGAVDEGCGQQC